MDISHRKGKKREKKKKQNDISIQQQHNTGFCLLLTKRHDLHYRS